MWEQYVGTLKYNIFRYIEVQYIGSQKYNIFRYTEVQYIGSQNHIGTRSTYTTISVSET